MARFAKANSSKKARILLAEALRRLTNGVIIWRSDRGEYLIVVTTAIRTRAIWHAVFSRRIETVSGESATALLSGRQKLCDYVFVGRVKSVRYTIAFVAPKLYQLQTLAASPSPMLTKH